jgi:hypothetical protein
MPRSHSRTMDNLRLQRRHYQFMAEVIRLAWDKDDRGMPSETLAETFANALRGTNANFDRARFLAACGNPPTPIAQCLLCQSEASHD